MPESVEGGAGIHRDTVLGRRKPWGKHTAFIHKARLCLHLYIISFQLCLLKFTTLWELNANKVKYKNVHLVRKF